METFIEIDLEEVEAQFVEQSLLETHEPLAPLGESLNNRTLDWFSEYYFEVLLAKTDSKNSLSLSEDPPPDPDPDPDEDPPSGNGGDPGVFVDGTMFSFDPFTYSGVFVSGPEGVSPYAILDEVIVMGTLQTQVEQYEFYYSVLSQLDWIGYRTIYGPGDIRDELRVPTGAEVRDSDGNLITPDSTENGQDIYSGYDGPNSAWVGIPDRLEGGTITIGGSVILIPGPYTCC